MNPPYCQTSVSILVTMNPLLGGGGGLGLVDGEVESAAAVAEDAPGGGDDTVAVVVVVEPAAAAPVKAGLQLWCKY